MAYQISRTKRYDVTVYTGAIGDFGYENVQILALDTNFVIFRDEDGKEHVVTGHLGIVISESDKK